MDSVLRKGFGMRDKQAGSLQPLPTRRLKTYGILFQICLYSCFQTKMVEKCGCAQYSQPLPPAANYCNYQQHPNWSECFHPQPCTPQHGNLLVRAMAYPVHGLSCDALELLSLLPFA